MIDTLRKAILDFSEELNGRIGNLRYDQILRYRLFPQETFPLRLVASILRLYYRDGKTEDEIAQAYDLTKWRVLDVHRKTIAALIAGEVISMNLCLNADIVKWIHTVRSEYLFHTEDELIKIVGKKDVRMFDLWEFDFVDVVDGVRFVIPKDTKRVYTQVGKAVISALRETVVPIDPEEIFEKIENHKKMEKAEKEYAPAFIDSILSCDILIDRNEKGEIALKAAYLSSDEQKIARIIYEAVSAITMKEAYARYETIYGHTASIVASTSLKKYGINNVQGNLWAYSNALAPIQSFIRDYAEERKIFYYSDLKPFLEENGYTITSSIRTYITNVCQVDNNDRLHFCHKDFVEDYPQYSWRNQSREGVTNWILNQIKDCLYNRETVSLTEVYDYIEEKAKETAYEMYIRQRVQYTLDTYSGDGQPFLLGDKNVMKNAAFFDSADFSILGLKGGKYPFFIQIRSIVLNEIKKAKDGRLLLVDAVNLINESLNEAQDRNTVIRAITNKHLPSISVGIKNIGGNLYIVRTGADIAAEPVFEIKSSAPLEETEIVQEVKNVDNRPGISYRLTFNLGELETVMKRELAFYKNWMMYEHIDIDEAIGKFIQFIQQAENDNLRRKLPQNLYEYWFASTDFFDRNMYVGNLALFYEGLLSEIKYQKDGVRLHKKGLGDWALEYPAMARSLGLPIKSARGFERIFCDLYFKRNKFAHGEPVEMSSSDTAKTIADYVALYIYTVAKYA